MTLPTAPTPGDERGNGRAASPRTAATVVLACTVACLVATVAAPADYRTVLAPLFALVLTLVGFGATLLARSRVLPADEIGAWYAAALGAYTILPLVVYVALGLAYTPLNDFRLFTAAPGPAEVARVGWYYAAYVAPFAAAYLWCRGRPEPARGVPAVPGPSAAVATVGIAAAVLLNTVIAQAFDLRPESYADTYRVIQGLPLPVRQLLRFVVGLRLIFSLVVLTWAFADFPRRKWIVGAWLTFEVVDTLVVGGERTGLMLLLASTAILYHRAVRPIRVRTALIGGPLLLLTFVALGVLRAYRQLTEPGGFQVGVSSGEFDTIFANAIDLLRRSANGELAGVPVRVLASDLLAVVPSQLLPVEKATFAEWYMARFYPAAAEAGQGYAFGVVPQAVLGFGVVELILRGTFVGWAFAKLDGIARRRSRQLWPTIGYIWMTLWAYQSFRASTFYVLSMLVQQFPAAVMTVELGRAFIVGALGGAGARRAPTAGEA
jgi:hypothetical protein